MATTAENVTKNDKWENVAEPYPPTFSFEKEGATLIGKYIKLREIEQPVIDKPDEMRKVNLYVIEDDNGQKWSVWGNFTLDDAFSRIDLGNTVRLIFHGKVPIHGGKQTVNQFTVDVKAS